MAGPQRLLLDDFPNLARVEQFQRFGQTRPMEDIAVQGQRSGSPFSGIRHRDPMIRQGHPECHTKRFMDPPRGQGAAADGHHHVLHR